MTLLLDNLQELLSKGDRVMAIDVGTKTLGIALNVTGYNLVTPLTIINRKKYRNDLDVLNDIIKQWQIKGIVFGLPLNMDGTSGKKVQSVKTIANNISRDTNLHYCFEDERLSSHIAEGKLIDIGVKHSKRKSVLDSHAATIILENYLYRIEKL